MGRIHMSFLVVLVLSFFVNESVSVLTLSNVLGDNMVLQKAPKQANIWGTADANAKITVTVSNQVFTATSESDGSFSVKLAPFEKGGAHILQVSSSSGESVTLRNVAFGDVWFCSGQSNMVMSVSQVFNASQEIAKAPQYPQIRVFTVGMGSASDRPEKNLLTVLQNWSVSSTSSIGGPDAQYFSAVCWFFGKNLADVNPGLPIGLISSDWGGTPIQAWMSPDALKSCPTEEIIPNDNIMVTPKETRADPNSNSALWNSMISPFLPNPIFGAIWYQGEANVGQAKQYACWGPAMVTDWRAKWTDSKDFTFFFVQLAPWNAGTSTQVPEVRDAQLAVLKLPGVGFATAVDLGDTGSPIGVIHPRNKQDVGLRLSKSARAITFGEKIAYLGPTITTARVVSQPPNVVIEVSFTPESVESGLVLRTFPDCPVSQDECGWYSIQLSDSRWYNATSTSLLQNNRVLQVSRPNSGTNLQVRGLRYGYASWPVCNLYNGAGLPGIPFQYMF